MLPYVFLSKPTQKTIDSFINTQASCELTYAPVGCTKHGPQAGFDFDQCRVNLGRGPDVFTVAVDALRRWQMFPTAWTQVIVRGEPHVGQTLGVLVRANGLWWLNSARIVDVVDDGGQHQFEFAYGTLPGHVESGEERFSIERDSDDTIWYEIRALSTPRHWVARIGYPLVRRLQRRFANDSQRSMIAAVDSGLAGHSHP